MIIHIFLLDVEAISKRDAPPRSISIGGFCFAILLHLKGLGGPVCSNHLRTLHFVLACSCIFIYIYYLCIFVYIYIRITIIMMIIVVLLYTIIVLYIYIMIDMILHYAYNYVYIYISHNTRTRNLRALAAIFLTIMFFPARRSSQISSRLMLE